MTKIELTQIVEYYVPIKADRESVLSAVNDYAEELITEKSPLSDFLDEVERMQKLYKNCKIGQAEELRDKLLEQLNDIMRK